MIRISGWLFCVVLLLAACKRESYLKDDPRYFQKHLTADMNYEQLVEAFGTPASEVNDSLPTGRGMHLYQYMLYDSTIVRIGFTTKIEYACLVDERNNLLEDLLQTSQD